MASETPLFSAEETCPESPPCPVCRAIAERPEGAHSDWLTEHTQALRDEVQRLKDVLTALIDECASSSCIHLNTLYGRLRVLRDGVA